MKTDRELLEAAARAVGMELILASYDPDWGFTVSGCSGWWNPLRENGDAFVLQVKLHMGVQCNGDDHWQAPNVTIVLYGEHHRITQPHVEGAQADTRRAIVRAAADMAPKPADPSVHAGAANMARKIDDDIYRSAATSPRRLSLAELDQAEEKWIAENNPNLQRESAEQLIALVFAASVKEIPLGSALTTQGLMRARSAAAEAVRVWMDAEAQFGVPNSPDFYCTLSVDGSKMEVTPSAAVRAMLAGNHPMQLTNSQAPSFQQLALARGVPASELWRSRHGPYPEAAIPPKGQASRS
jgi:hypothetical protein